MPHRSRDNLGKSFPNTPTTSRSQPSLLFGGCNQEDPLGEHSDIFEEPIVEEKEESIPLEPIDENINARGNGERIEGATVPYGTKEIKAVTKEKVAEFFRENIFYKFSYLRELIIDQVVISLPT